MVEADACFPGISAQVLEWGRGAIAADRQGHGNTLDMDVVAEKLRDMAASAYETAMAFGVSQDSFERLARQVFDYALLSRCGSSQLTASASDNPPLGTEVKLYTPVVQEPVMLTTEPNAKDREDAVALTAEFSNGYELGLRQRTSQDLEDVEVTAYALPGGISVERCMQLNGTYLWAIRDSFKNCLGKGGEWDYEPFPSSRTESWLAQHRFDSADAAIDAARAAKGAEC
jgi:hypothetical protein